MKCYKTCRDKRQQLSVVVEDYIVNQEDNHLHMLVLLGAGSAESLVAFDSSEDILYLSRDAMVSLSDWGAGGPGFYSRVLQGGSTVLYLRRNPVCTQKIIKAVSL